MGQSTCNFEYHELLGSAITGSGPRPRVGGCETIGASSGSRGKEGGSASEQTSSAPASGRCSFRGFVTNSRQKRRRCRWDACVQYFVGSMCEVFWLSVDTWMAVSVTAENSSRCGTSLKYRSRIDQVTCDV